VVGLLITKLLSLSVIFFKLVIIWQSYKQEHFARLTNTLLKDEESARYNHALACNFAKYSKKYFFLLPTQP